MALRITNGVILRPQRVVIYGPEGIGKTTLASKFSDPLFIDTEDGSGHLNVKRLAKPTGWGDLIATVSEVARTDGVCKTLVLDTADWAEALCIDSVCKSHNQKSIEAFGYGKGYVYVMEEWQKLLRAFDKVIASGKAVVITAHAKMRKFEQPDEIGAYDRWEMKLSKQVAPLVKEWCDCLLFLNYKTTVITDASGKAKAQGGKRWVYTTHNPCWDAKNRLAMKEDMELNGEEIAALFAAIQNEAPKEEPKTEKQDKKADKATTEYDRLMILMKDKDHPILPAEVRQVVADRQKKIGDRPIKEYPNGFIDKWLIPHWPEIVDAIESDPDRRKVEFTDLSDDDADLPF